MMPEELQAIKDRAEKATPGPWAVHYPQNRSRPYIVALDEDGVIFQWVTQATGKGVQDDQDFQFIAHARQDIPALLEEVERLQAKVAELKEEIVTLEGVVQWGEEND